ncbi:MAG: sulfotransferase [Veillonellaceae bacterium]|nr:sulfotransferase [Veillonellaceae bacterium]
MISFTRVAHFQTSPKRYHDKMIPFIIVGHPRSGSTLLREAMAQHSEIKVLGELFHKLENERKNTHFVRKRDGTKVYYQGNSIDALEFLYENVWNSESERYHAVGFKLFGERVQCIGADRLFVRLKEEVKGLHVVHIIRDNLLDMWVSRKKAEQSGVWRVPVLGKVPVPKRALKPIKVDPVNLQKCFETYSKTTRFFERHFRDTHYLAIHYDMLTHDFKQQLEKVFEFFNVKKIDCKMTIKKQNTTPHDDFIINFDELKEYFKLSQYAFCFDQ